MASNAEYNHTIVSNLNQIGERIEVLLAKHPEYRNMDDTEFWLQYCDHYLGFRVGSILTYELKADIGKYANPQSVSRMLRKLREPELKRMNALIQMLLELKETNQEEYRANLKIIQAEAHRCKYIPYNVDVLIHKFIKEKAMREVMADAQRWI